MADRLAMQDTREQYPKPPFPRQPQPVPGLARKMEPQPDHGEGNLPWRDHHLHVDRQDLDPLERHRPNLRLHARSVSHAIAWARTIIERSTDK